MDKKNKRMSRTMAPIDLVDAIPHEISARDMEKKASR